MMVVLRLRLLSVHHPDLPYATAPMHISRIILTRQFMSDSNATTSCC